MRTSTRAFFGLSTLLLVGILSYWGGVTHGRSSGYRRAADLLWKSKFICTFSAVQSLRQGDYTNAIERLEAACYSAAVSILEEPNSAKNPLIGAFKSDLIEYRRKHAHAASEQYPTEQRLDTLLAPRDGVRTNMNVGDSQ